MNQKPKFNTDTPLLSRNLSEVTFLDFFQSKFGKIQGRIYFVICIMGEILAVIKFFETVAKFME